MQRPNTSSNASLLLNVPKSDEFSVNVQSSNVEMDKDKDSFENIILEDSCPICLDPINSEPIAVLSCGHVFHQKCINSWDTKLYNSGQPFRCAMCLNEGSPPTGRSRMDLESIITVHPDQHVDAYNSSRNYYTVCYIITSVVFLSFFVLLTSWITTFTP
ncbi:RING-finger domain-containing protein [Tetraselmis virus 1]|uniref:RING-finger domain-containing protein n=1 Tax=Tetraselmis virus 1 TaxID=2060617 RepID=A0A2P0VNM5_9VIRU|nr:RING-finger domain-containing protein [Tetraselmis virus 1]AUF82516.1 RING-finger domain-containing protein [Tetraselmis virus 1]